MDGPVFLLILAVAINVWTAIALVRLEFERRRSDKEAERYARKLHKFIASL